MAKSFSPEQQKSFDYALDATKQLIALSTAVLTISLAIVQLKGLNDASLIFLSISWLCLLASIISGVLTQYSLVTELLKPSHGSVPSIMSKEIRTAAAYQICLFILGVGLIVGLTIYTVYLR